MSTVKLISIWQCTPDAIEAFEQELKRLVDASITEDGHIHQEIYQPKDSTGEYVLMEEWQHEAALVRHQTSPHYKYFMRIAPVLQTKPTEIRQLVRLV